MKIHSLPEELTATLPDFMMDGYVEAVERHMETVITWLNENGFNGKNTGRLLSVPYADGHANYMFAHRTSGSVLVHLPYWDGWHSQDVQYLPQKVVLERIAARERLTAFLKAREQVQA